MTDSDKLEIKQIVHDALAPIEDKLDLVAGENRSIFQAMFGLTGTNGLNNDVGKLKSEIEQLKTFKTRVVTVFAVIQAALIVIVQIMIYWMKSKLGG